MEELEHAFRFGGVGNCDKRFRLLNDVDTDCSVSSPHVLNERSLPTLDLSALLASYGTSN